MFGMDLIVTFIGLAAAGMFIGVCSGLLGIGGGAIMIPLLRLVFGLNAYMATATSLFTMVFTSFSGAVSHVRNRTCYLQLGVALGFGGAITSALGVYAGSHSPAWAIILAAAIIIFYSAYTMLSKALKLPKSGARANVAERSAEAHAPQSQPATAGERTPGGSAMLDSAPELTFNQPITADKQRAASGTAPSCTLESAFDQPVTADEFRPSKATLAKGFAVGLVAGFCAGYVGVGGGFIMVPLMTSWLGVPMKKASGTSVVAIIILAIPGVIGQMALGHVDYLAGFMLAAGSIPGAIVGARLIKYVNERQLRFLFAGFLLAAGVMLLCNEFGQML